MYRLIVRMLIKAIYRHLLELSNSFSSRRGCYWWANKWWRNDDRL